MRAFIVIASLVVLASADVKHLYDAPYNKPASSVTYTTSTSNVAPSIGFTSTTTSGANNGGFVSGTGLLNGGSSTGFVNGGSSTGFVNGGSNTKFVSGGSTTYGSGSGFANGGAATYGSGSGFGSGFGSGSSSTGFGSGFGNGGSGSGFSGSSTSNVQTHTTLVKQTAPLVSKSSYVFSAPEEKEDFQHDQTIVLPRPKQHYKVVFIQAPATTYVNYPSAAVGGQTQEKTLIYVLSNKKRIENHIDVPEVDQAKLQKPEVFFIKHNAPTQVVNSKIKYETVDTVPGAEYGSVNGVANKVSGNGQIQEDTVSTPEQSHIAQSIYQAVQSGGVQQGVQTVDQLIAAGLPVSNYGGESYSNGGSYTETQGQTFHTGAVLPTQTQTKYTTTQYVQQPAAVSYETTSSQGYNY